MELFEVYLERRRSSSLPFSGQPITHWCGWIWGCVEPTTFKVWKTVLLRNQAKRKAHLEVFYTLDVRCEGFLLGLNGCWESVNLYVHRWYFYISLRGEAERRCAVNAVPCLTSLCSLVHFCSAWLPYKSPLIDTMDFLDWRFVKPRPLPLLSSSMEPTRSQTARKYRPTFRIFVKARIRLQYADV